MSHFNKNLCFFKVRGYTYNVEIGYVMKLARESLISKFAVAVKRINKRFEHINRTYGDFLHLTSNPKELKIVK